MVEYNNDFNLGQDYNKLKITLSADLHCLVISFFSLSIDNILNISSIIWMYTLCGFQAFI